MTKKKAKRPDPESEAALKEVIVKWAMVRTWLSSKHPIVSFYERDAVKMKNGMMTGRLIARLDLRKVIRKRAGLKGIRSAEKAMRKATRGRK